MFHVRQQSPLYPARTKFLGTISLNAGIGYVVLLVGLYDMPVYTGDEVSCAACVQQRSYDNIIDNFCTADFGQLNIITHSWEVVFVGKVSEGDEIEWP